MDVRVHYYLSEAFRKQHYAETGEFLAEEQSALIDTSQASQGQREAIAPDLEGKDQPVVNLINFSSAYRTRDGWAATKSDTRYQVDHLITDATGLVEECQAMNARREQAIKNAFERERADLERRVADLTDTLKRKLAKRDPTGYYSGLSQIEVDFSNEIGFDLTAYRDARKAFDEAQPIFEAEKAAREAEAEHRKELEKATVEAEKVAWVRANGSDHLRRCVEAGYDCQRLYVTERAALEHPGYLVDFDNRADWKSRACPSPDAMDEVESAGGDAQVVWLTEPPSGSDEEDFDECEAVIITILGRYRLVKIIQ
jgi:hypothetical protein